MKKFTIISAAMFLALAAISCRKEGFEDKTGTTVLNVVITDGTKTALGEKEADAYPNYWKTGDEISVNGVVSDALDESFDGKSSAAFTFGDALETPYYAAYPASAVSDYDSGAAVITVPGTQKYVEGSYDPEAFIMTGVSSTEGTVSISAKVGIFHLSLTGEGNISKVVLSGLNGEALSGDFTTDFSVLTPKTVSDKVELVCGSPVALPAEFFLCIPAGTYAKLQVEAFDDEGGVMSKNATLKEALPAGGMFSAPTLAFNPSYDFALEASLKGVTTSSAAFTWTHTGDKDFDISKPYTIALYSDQACSSKVISLQIPADAECWDGKQPCFVFGGLKPSTDYWLKVTDTTNGIESNPVKATTDDFTVVTLPSEITGTGIALAEDFGELRWDFEKCFGAAGYFPSSTSDFSNTGVSSYRKSGDSGEKTFKGQGTALGKSRLNDWVTDSNVYVHPGSLKLGTSSARGWILTPEFKVPEGKKAVVNVTVTAARHDGSQDQDWAIAVLSQDLAKANPSAHTADFSWPDVDDATLYQTINITNSSVWNTRTVSGLEIHSGDRIVFGGVQGGDGKKGRVWISDLTVEVTALVDDIAGAKKLSIIGDSISSFEGWLPEGNKYFADYYIGGGLQDWTKTYWGALCTKYMAGKLQMEKNISWTGSCVAQDTRTGSSYRPAFVTRYGKSNVGATYALNSIGSPDIVIIYGGTNDRYNSGYGLSDVNSTPDDAEFDAIFKKSNDNLVVTSFVQAYVKLINMVHADCPDAKIINIIGDYVTLEQIASIKKISDHYTFCKYVDFSNGGSGNPKIGKLNGVHPNIDGMDYMAKTIFGELGDWMLED